LLFTPFDAPLASLAPRGLTSSPPLEYEWEINGDVVLHRDEGSTYTGKFSQDGKVLDGGWRPNEGQDSSDYNSSPAPGAEGNTF